MDIKEEVKKILFENGVSNRGHIARQILNLPVSEERVCSNCRGVGWKTIFEIAGNSGTAYNKDCLDCNGTGKLPPQTLKQLIEEAQNE